MGIFIRFFWGKTLDEIHQILVRNGKGAKDRYEGRSITYFMAGKGEKKSVQKFGNLMMIIKIRFLGIYFERSKQRRRTLRAA